MRAYLKTDKRFGDHFNEVWLWDKFPARHEFGQTDVGIDLVACESPGTYLAIWCIGFAEDSQTDKAAVDTVSSTSGRSFSDPKTGQRIHFSHRLWISTTNRSTNNANEALQHQHPAVARLNLSKLQQAPVDWALLHKGLSGDAARQEKKTARDRQKEAIERTHAHF